MRKLIVLLLVASALASVKYDGSTNDFSCTAANVLIAGNLAAMTVTTWVNIHSTTGGTFISSADNGVGGWKFNDFGANSTDNLEFVKSHIVAIDAPAAVKIASTNAWTFAAAVITSTQIHFATITAGGTLTTGNTSDSNSFAAAGTNGRICQDITSNGAGGVLEPLNASIGETCVWGTTALTDGQLKEVAFRGCRAIGIKPTAYWPSEIMTSTLSRAADVIPPGTFTFTNMGGPPVQDAPPPLAPPIGEMH